jgi:hypothetical protein
MPQEWRTNWLLPDGSKGVALLEMDQGDQKEPRVAATRARERAIGTLGNLTILTSSLNPALSNLFWDKKRPEMMKHSLLPINQSLFDLPAWNEKAILDRAEQLFGKAAGIWQR